MESKECPAVACRSMEKEGIPNYRRKVDEIPRLTPFPRWTPIPGIGIHDSRDSSNVEGDLKSVPPPSFSNASKDQQEPDSDTLSWSEDVGATTVASSAALETKKAAVVISISEDSSEVVQQEQCGLVALSISDDISAGRAVVSSKKRKSSSTHTQNALENGPAWRLHQQEEHRWSTPYPVTQARFLRTQQKLSATYGVPAIEYFADINRFAVLENQDEDCCLDQDCPAGDQQRTEGGWISYLKRFLFRYLGAAGAFLTKCSRSVVEGIRSVWRRASLFGSRSSSDDSCY